jgi:hypothetical protein
VEDCDIRVLPDELSVLRNMTILMLSGNRLASVPHCVYSMLNLVCLDLRDNFILRVDHVLLNAQSLHDLQRLSLLLLPSCVDIDSVERACPHLRQLKGHKQGIGRVVEEDDAALQGSPMGPLRGPAQLLGKLVASQTDSRELRFVSE